MSGDAFEDDFPADFDHDLVQSDERLADYVDGRLGERDRERFEAELRVSPQLREHLAEYQRTVAVLQQALRAPTHPTHLADRVMANLAAAATRPSVVQRKLRPLLFAAASAAALLALALVVDRLGAPASQHRSDFAKVDGDDAPPPPVVSPRPPGADGSWQPLDELLGRGAPSKADRPASETEEVEGSAAVPGEVLRLEQQQAPAADGAAVGEPAPAPGLPTPGAAAPRSVENGSVENGSVEKGVVEKLGEKAKAIPPGAKASRAAEDDESTQQVKKENDGRERPADVGAAKDRSGADKEPRDRHVDGGQVRGGRRASSGVLDHLETESQPREGQGGEAGPEVGEVHERAPLTGGGPPAQGGLGGSGDSRGPAGGGSATGGPVTGGPATGGPAGPALPRARSQLGQVPSTGVGGGGGGAPVVTKGAGEVDELHRDAEEAPREAKDRGDVAARKGAGGAKSAGKADPESASEPPMAPNQPGAESPALRFAAPGERGTRLPVVILEVAKVVASEPTEVPRRSADDGRDAVVDSAAPLAAFVATESAAVAMGVTAGPLGGDDTDGFFRLASDRGRAVGGLQLRSVAAGAPGAGEGTTRDWLVSGTRAELERLMREVARAAAATGETLRTGEVGVVGVPPAVRGARAGDDGAAAGELLRVVLRFRGR